MLKGPYLGQPLPGDTPMPFAPGVVSCGLFTRDITWTPDGKELYFSVSAFGFNLVFQTRIADGVWTEPAPASFSRDARYLTYEPHVAPDGKRLFFLSDKPLTEGGERNQNIWAVDRAGDGWGEPHVVGGTVSTEDAEYFPSTTRDGTLYFTRMPKGERTNWIYRARRQGDGYGPAEKLPPEVNCGTNRFNAWIDPDERFIIVPAAGMPDTIGSTDYYIVFCNFRDEWSRPVNLGPAVNTTGGQEFSPALSPDGKFFFFMTTRPNPGTADRLTRGAYMELQAALSRPGNGSATVYWMSSAFLENLRPSPEGPASNPAER
ncbi:MAG: hypothetical protein NTZ26_10460 [Candidatus Aminicenantes bacterium]|nr:hypothetical protein [Candidatus Aminicenantes bacterium]